MSQKPKPKPVGRRRRPVRDLTGVTVSYTSFDSLLNSFVPGVLGPGRDSEVMLESIRRATHDRPATSALVAAYGVSRQRISQITHRARAQMRRDQALALLNDFWGAVQTSIQRHGGLVRLPQLATELAQRFGWGTAPALGPLALFIRLNPRFRVDWETGFVLRPDLPCLDCPDLVPRVYGLLHDGAETATTRQAARELTNRCRSSCTRGWPRTLRPAIIELAAVRSRRKLFLDGDRVSTRGYHLIQTRPGTNLRLALKVILREKGRPLHFRELARLARERFPQWTGISDRGVRFAVRRDAGFKRAGRGTYGLSTWKFPPFPRAADAIAALLARHRRPMHRDDITALLTREGQYSRNHLRLLLREDPRFVQVGSQTYDLRSRARKRRASRI